jgi:hypothetical protein
MARIRNVGNIHDLLELLSQSEKELVSLLDRRDVIFFTLPGWLRQSAGLAREAESTVVVDAQGAWQQYRGVEEEIAMKRKMIKTIECKIATIPVTSFDQLIAKAGYARTMICNSGSADFSGDEEPQSLEELFVHHLEKDIRKIAALYDKKKNCRKVGEACLQEG